MTGSEMTIQAALSAVMGDVQAVRKKDRNTSQNFSFRGIDAVVNAVGPALRTHQVVVMPRVINRWVETYATRNGTTMKNITVEVEFTFVGPDGSTLTCSALGEASDAGDKATSKAHSVAFRVALLQALCIPTDEPDPDSFSHERAARPVVQQEKMASDPDIARIRDALSALDEESLGELRGWCVAQGMPRYDSGRLTEAQAKAWLEHLENLPTEAELVDDEVLEPLTGETDE